MAKKAGKSKRGRSRKAITLPAAVALEVKPEVGAPPLTEDHKLKVFEIPIAATTLDYLKSEKPKAPQTWVVDIFARIKADGKLPTGRGALTGLATQLHAAMKTSVPYGTTAVLSIGYIKNILRGEGFSTK